MPKNILIFSDGTGQIGGIKPDQRLSNIYKMFRAMRPGPDSNIDPANQVAFYDPGLGAGEVGGLTFGRVSRALEAAVGTGIDQNVIECYEFILAHYEPGDRVLVFGFSRGAYTARALANVMNLCGVPSHMSDGSPVPKCGDALRAVAREAVLKVYNHGAGKKRGDKEYERETLGRRFRAKYGSAPSAEYDDVQGNVQPHFIGVFDTVAALGNAKVTWVVRGLWAVSFALLLASLFLDWGWWLRGALIGTTGLLGYWYGRVLKSQFKLFQPDPDKPLKWWNPVHWRAIAKHSHYSAWNRKHYDRWLDSDVGFARHALSIDEHRKDFPRVKWASSREMKKNQNREIEWLLQVWFAGCHSDIGGSYPETESRLSDISLKWMIDELRQCVPSVAIRPEVLNVYPDPLGQQHSEVWMFKRGIVKRKWPVGPRNVSQGFALHPSVIERLSADSVAQPGAMKPYRPQQLKDHPEAKAFFAPR
jgi:uncharacterized protein (DUF2235 family)